MRYVTVFLVCLAFVWALGEKPKQSSESGTVTGEQSVAMQHKATADEQYLWLIQNYDQAQRDQYDKSIAKALDEANYFVDAYAKDARLPTVYFYIARLHGLQGATAAQEQALQKYFAVATTANPVYLLARLDRAALTEISGNAQAALTEYEAVYAEASPNTTAKDEALLRLIPSYEATEQTDKLKAAYTFFVEHPDKLPNRDLYFVYAYRLGVIWYNEGNKSAAARYFSIVKSGTAPSLKLFKESIDTKYK